MSDSSDTRFSYTGLEKPNVANVGMSTPLDLNSPFKEVAKKESDSEPDLEQRNEVLISKDLPKRVSRANRRLTDYLLQIIFCH